MSNEERKIYDMVVRRFLAVLCPASEYEDTTVTASFNNETFLAKGTIYKTPGWREVYEDSNYSDVDCDEEELPMQAASDSLMKLKSGMQLCVKTFTITEGKNKATGIFYRRYFNRRNGKSGEISRKPR